MLWIKMFLMNWTRQGLILNFTYHTSNMKRPTISPWTLAPFFDAQETSTLLMRPWISTPSASEHDTQQTREAQCLGTQPSQILPTQLASGACQQMRLSGRMDWLSRVQTMFSIQDPVREQDIRVKMTLPLSSEPKDTSATSQQERILLMLSTMILLVRTL